MQEGVREGWYQGFDDGTEFGISKVFKEAFLKGVDLGVLEVKELIDYNRLKKDKMNEYEKIFVNVDYNDGVERLLKLIEDFKGFSKKKKLKYTSISAKNLNKLIYHMYTEKWATQKTMKQILVELVFDQTKIKYGKEGVLDRKLFQLFASVVYHGQVSKRAGLMAKFLHLGKKCYSNEVLSFALYLMWILKGKNMANQFHKAGKHQDDDFISIPRALETFNEVF
jgi:hypothetical protein